jgi:hypothetical protein
MFFHIYISVAMDQIGKHVPAKANSWLIIGKVFSLPGKAAINIHPQQWETVFLWGPCKGVILKTNGSGGGVQDRLAA